jgi:hypothetical protein
MQTYSLGYVETLALPAKVFWLLNKNIDRMAAESDLRLIQIGFATQSGEAAEKHIAELQKQYGRVVEIDEVAAAMNAPRDRDGLLALKDLGRIG